MSISIDGVLYVKVVDAFRAAYGVEDPHFAITQLAQTTMRSEIGKISLDNTFKERELLNDNIVKAINAAALEWGISCMRYEIRDIAPPKAVLAAMALEAEAERRKRAFILDSEGEQEAEARALPPAHRRALPRARRRRRALPPSPAPPIVPPLSTRPCRAVRAGQRGAR